MKNKSTSLMLLALLLTIGGAAQGSSRSNARGEARLREKSESGSAVTVKWANEGKSNQGNYLRTVSLRFAEVREARVERITLRPEIAADFDRTDLASVRLEVRHEKEKIGSGHHHHRRDKAEGSQQELV
jgi:hypothetical protein